MEGCLTIYACDCKTLEASAALLSKKWESSESPPLVSTGQQVEQAPCLSPSARCVPDSQCLLEFLASHTSSTVGPDPTGLERVELGVGSRFC
eukprot:3486888-Amphidinium_carterae.1